VQRGNIIALDGLAAVFECECRCSVEFASEPVEEEDSVGLGFRDQSELREGLEGLEVKQVDWREMDGVKRREVLVALHNVNQVQRDQSHQIDVFIGILANTY
jgi:hypothetical protein